MLSVAVKANRAGELAANTFFLAKIDSFLYIWRGFHWAVSSGFPNEFAGEVSMNRQSHPIFRAIGVGGLLVLFLVTANASQAADNLKHKTLTLGLVSATSQREIEKHFQDLASYVARRLPLAGDTEGRVLVASSALQMAKLLEQKEVDFYFESAYPTYIINKQGAAVLILRRWKRDMADYRSLIFTKSGSGTTRLEDLLGKMIAFEDPGSTSGYFLPKVFLLKKGFNLTEKPGLKAKIAPNEIGYVFASSGSNIADWVLSRQVAAGTFSDDDYRKLNETRRAEIAILAQTEAFPRHLVSVRKDLDPAVRKDLKEILLSIDRNEEGRRILQQTDNTKFDLLPGGEEKVRRQLMELFRPR
jgi:phosphonate transport system substrate-binding protein